MAYAAVITHVRPDAGATPRLSCARAIAERFNARLIGMGAEMIPPLAFDNGFYSADAEWVVAMRDSIEGQLKDAHAAFAGATEGMTQATAWLSGVDSPTPALAAASRAADLIVAGGVPRHPSSPYKDVDSAELAMLAGRPVLVAPPSAPDLTASKVVLAWKDTREARRALTDALPFLAAAESVLVLEVCDQDGAADAASRVEDVAGALRARGISAESRVDVHGKTPVGEHIVETALAFGADLVVLGCFGHSRLGEWAFGGVTRDLLAQDAVHLLLSH